MVKFYLKQILVSILILLGSTSVFAQQVPNPSFEDWSGEKYDGNEQLKDWYASNVTQAGFKFNLAHKEAGHSGSYSMMVQDTEVGAMGITEVSPGYFSLGKPWTHLPSITEINKATAGTSGGINFKYRPDTMSVWIKRTGGNVDKEDFYLLYYAWSGTAKGSKYMGKNGSCTSVSQTNEESDIRLALDANKCGTDQKANQIAEGMWREKKEYGNWTNIRVPIYYFNNDVPTMMNIIFSASNYPNYRANDGLYKGNSLYVDDVELIYSSKIDKLYIGGKEWKAFDPNSSEEQNYSLGRTATSIPTITAVRGVGSITNARGETVSFSGRELSGSEISITNGEIDGAPTVITVKSEDGKKTTTYKIKFVREASTNAKLASIYVNGIAINNFKPDLGTYTHQLPYGTTEIPEVSVEKQEDEQTVEITQASSLTGTATIQVTAADKKSTKTYTVTFSVAKLSDNTLKDIKVNGVSIPGFTPSQTIYRVSLPTTTTTIPEVEAVSAYPAGEQTITHTAPASAANLDGSQHVISVTTPGNPTPKTYKLNYKLEASNYSLLNNLQMGESLITNFDPQTFTYYVNFPIGTTEIPAITYEKGEASQTVSINTDGLSGTEGVIKVIVVAGNGVDQSEYKIVVTTAKSSISTLDMIYLDGTPLAGFASNITSYSHILPVGTTVLPTITYDQGDEYQSVKVNAGDVNSITRIVVTAEDGSSTIYQITFSVAKATNASLKMIYLDGTPLAEFDPNVLYYNCPLPQGTTELPIVTYDPGDEYQKITTRDEGLNGEYKITVRPQSGPSQVYILHFSVITSDNADLKMIYLNGDSLEGFHADTLNYIDTLPMGVLTIPTVTFDKGEAAQKVLSISNKNTQTIKVTAESGKSKTYTITFVIQRSNSAFLNMIYLDGDSLVGFDKNIFDYTVSLEGATCPMISVDKEEGQQVTITAPYSTGQAKITVTPETGDPNIYTINFVDVANNHALLKNIYVDGTSIAGFAPEVFVYDSITCSSIHALITYQADSTQTVTEFRNKNIVTLYVESGKDRAQYEIILYPQENSDCTLRDITMEGVTITGFTPSTYTYTIAVPASTTTPNIGYKKQYAEQVVYAGMLNAHTYSLLVAAQSGDTARYTLHLDVQLSSDANLIDLQLQGISLSFDPNTYTYNVSLPEGYDLPNILVETKPGQDVAMHSVSDTEQQVIVTAPNGNTNTYTILYDRDKSTNAWLTDILINGVSLEEFDATVFNYTDTLAWRTKIVPCVQPIGSHPDQVITTYHSAVDGITKIEVLAPDGVTKQEYTIHFPVIKSNNTALASIILDHETLSIDYQPNTTEYNILLPYGEYEVPLVIYEPLESEQTIQYISRPLGQTSEIIVTAENGDKATYKLHFAPTYASKPNQLASLIITETGTTIDPTETEHVIALPYGTRTMTVEYTKQFTEQTVWVQPGGVNNPTIITVKSNRPNEEDMVYTLTPQVETQDPAVLTEISINGTPIAEFDPNRFAYIVNVESAPIIRYQIKQGALINITEQTSKHWQAEVTYGGRTNIYNVWYYYKNDQVPNTEFTEWTTCDTYTSAPKPRGWYTIADVLGKHSGFGSFNPDGMVSKSGSDAVFLKTPYSTPGGGNIPGFITLGKVTGKWGVAGSSSFGISGGINFHNTPDQLDIRYYNSKVKNHSLIQYSLTGTHGVKTLEWKDSETQSDYKVVTMDLGEANKAAGDPTLLNITLCSFNSIAGTTNTALNTLAEMYVDYIRFSYNSTLTGLKVNDSIAAMDGNTFSYTLPDSENTLLPTLTFTGEVADQAQQIVWSEETKADGFSVRNAMITNYAEDGTSTEYTLELKRPLDTKNTLSDLLLDGSTITAFVDTKTNYTVRLASHTKNLPDVQPVAASSLQTITTSYADSTITIVVTPESGAATTYTVQFVTELSNDVELTNITANGIVFDPAITDYTITADKLPEITFVKKMDGQTVNLENGVLHVTAENGATGTYTIHLDKPMTVTTGQLADIEFNGISLQGFNSNTYNYQVELPERVAFKRVYESDSVVFVQTANYMEWQVYGDEQHTYRIAPSSVLSDNTFLKAIYIDSTLYSEFNELIYDYEYRTDNPVHIHAVANDQASKLDVTYTTQGDTALYTYVVTAEDGTVGTPYTLAIVPNLSNMKYLQGILLDGKPLAGFRADSLEYNIIIPTGAYKAVEPTMPSIQYILGAPRQQVTIEHGGMGASTHIVVISEDGAHQTVYQLQFDAEPSHCASLSGIAVNGSPIEHFDSHRRYYSVKTSEENVTLTWSSQDNFQTVTVSEDQYSQTLHVTAQDGTTTADYIVEIYQELVSSDVTLANILLDGATFDTFNPIINPDLDYSPMQQRYTIYLPAGSTLPQISALLNSEGQMVDIVTNGQTIEIHVTAPDKISTNVYILRFVVPKSSNALLEMIYLESDSLSGFDPTHFNYFIDLPIGQDTMPKISAIPQESTQIILDSITGMLQHTIFVTAEDGTTQQYLLAFQRTYSEADTLLAIYGDDVLIDQFRPDSFYYAYTLPIGTDYFPTISWLEADSWQTVTQNLILDTPTKQITQLEVVAGSGKKNIYTISYEILLSAVDTLQEIYMGATLLEGFNPNAFEYYIYLNPGDSVAPSVSWLEGDKYQIVTPTTIPYTINGEQIGWKTTLQVLAQDGHIQTYNIYFLFSKVLSTNTDLLDIYLNGEPMEDFDPAIHTYRITVSYGDKKPSVLATAAEPTQLVTIEHGDTTIITVTAEDTTFTDTYTLIFNYLQSPYAYLEGIYQDDVLIDGYRADSMEYHITLPYGTTDLPVYSYKTGIDGQVVEVDTIITTNSDGQTVTCYSFIVLAPDEETSVQYDVYVTVALNDDCSLQTLQINGIEIEGFHADTTTYHITYPVGSDSTILVTQEAITAIANDPLATVSVSSDGYDFTIIVTAQDGTTRIYTITQTILLSSNTRLMAIYINEVLIRDFDPDVLEYTYYVTDVQPAVEAIPEDSTTTVDYSMYSADEPFYIYVTAEDGSEQVYTIYFISSTIQTSATPSANDVLVKYLGDMTFGAATLRKNVSIAVYTTEGQQLFLNKLEETSQNDAIIGTNADGQECLMDVYTTSTQFTLPETNQMFFYVFLENGEKRIASGKLIVTP